MEILQENPTTPIIIVTFGSVDTELKGALSGSEMERREVISKLCLRFGIDADIAESILSHLQIQEATMETPVQSRPST